MHAYYTQSFISYKCTLFVRYVPSRDGQSRERRLAEAQSLHKLEGTPFMTSMPDLIALAPYLSFRSPLLLPLLNQIRIPDLTACKFGDF